jgi:hypothetical protein
MSGRMGKIRNIVLVWLVWPFLTLGIYHLVWWYKINREVRDVGADIEVSPAVAVVAISLARLSSCRRLSRSTGLGSGSAEPRRRPECRSAAPESSG